MGKAKVRKNIKGFEKQLKIHKDKLANSIKDNNVGLTRYYEKELGHLNKNLKKWNERNLPKKKRKNTDNLK
ncbi:hypothetical protein HOE22_12570 [Candidatus Woesearchaeota archaeon]|jgi:hypothetical protein|nr:hypothetical protein [Candidatus Woesearchaeota archaeon]MBT4058655.1 hypothetical protein [Candidatus Woesearchaeota archaeon]MBT4209155.1 hypothetical protein [Candidatus Woesearchaeota archaeon]MBT4732416.1 hypothetical protein [Candidatus Woesearchaeota archaeon]MBT4783071.1 hypothetical protein [Candidatus Woesearchaeota archaeon]